MVHPRSFWSIPTQPGQNPDFPISHFCLQNPFFGIPRCRFLTFFDQKSKNMDFHQMLPECISDMSEHVTTFLRPFWSGFGLETRPTKNVPFSPFGVLTLLLRSHELKTRVRRGRIRHVRHERLIQSKCSIWTECSIFTV